MKANCKNCEKEFEYSPKSTFGLYCSNQCQGDFQVRQRFTKNKKWKHSMGVYLKKIRGNECEVCHITEYNGLPLTMHIDHINGDRFDNRYENLKVLCPNCHSQTETFAWKNVSQEGRNKQKLSGKEIRQNQIKSQIKID
jgi:endogenous inhibitor of DNA gyrase (YacG/DUF329 family)